MLLAIKSTVVAINIIIALLSFAYSFSSKNDTRIENLIITIILSGNAILVWL